ncbi:alanine dehydrogenase [Paenibacillus sp. GP183]|uniref:alanine dehydrogenase n=1 Tax=Paenibacillus sp. GP183 TaxID=1882751 RepID=UPI00089C6EAC|nr:alanine dehydrogenase [Paenibacillus sp. GP183]SEB48787.1 alanine dehydrogenase [Paenibacillus sp. GP183]
MRIGVPKEMKNRENRVALTPYGVKELVHCDHEVAVQYNAGLGAGFADEEYSAAGATLMEQSSDIWSFAELLLKVKEPLPAEYRYFREGLILICYLHLAAEPKLVQALTAAKVTAIVYETVELNRMFPLLTPMSEIAGRMSIQIGTHLLEMTEGGKGVLLGGVPGVKRGKVTIIGGGVVGSNAAKIAIGLGADVTVIDMNQERLRILEDIHGSRIQTLASSPSVIEDAVAEADLMIGAVLVPGAKAPKLVTEDMVRQMSVGSVILDVAIDQGGIFETGNRLTTHDDPVYIKHGVLHYAVPNIPGAVPRTSTIALCQATFPYVMLIANNGVGGSIERSDALLCGINIAGGHVTHQAVANDLALEYVPVEQLLSTFNR